MACFLMTATLCLTALALHRIFCSIYSISITIPLALLSSHPPPNTAPGPPQTRSPMGCFRITKRIKNKISFCLVSY